MKAKKITGLVISIVVLVLAVLILVTAFVPKNFNFKLNTPNSITIYKGDGSQLNSYDKEDDEFKEIMNLYNKGLKTSMLSAFFQGKAFSKVQTIDSTRGFSSSNMDSSLLYIEFHYLEAQKTDKHGSNVNFSTDQETYNYVVIEVKNSGNLKEINAYIRKDGDINSYSYIKYTSYGSFSSLYSYLNDLVG